MNGWARLLKTHKGACTDTETVEEVVLRCAGRLVLLAAWNCVVGTAAMMLMMDYSGKLAGKTLHSLWKNRVTKWSST